MQRRESAQATEAMEKTSDLMLKYADRITERDFYASKSDYGKLLIIAGSAGMAGAAFLSGLAAFRSGIGMVRYFGPESNRTILQTLLPEAMYDADGSVSEEGNCSAEKLRRAVSWADMIICGPGLSTGKRAKDLVKQLFVCELKGKKLVLLDADALNVVSSEKIRLIQLSGERSRKGYGSPLVITPHVGEMSRLNGRTIAEIKADPVGTAAAWASENHCTVVLKDAVSYVAFPDGTVRQNDSGHAALAKAGSGDVLTGVIAGMTAVIGKGAAEGAAAGTFVHGKAGELAAAYHGEHSVLARDVADAVSGVIGSASYKYDRVFDTCEDECPEMEK